MELSKPEAFLFYFLFPSLILTFLLTLIERLNERRREREREWRERVCGERVERERKKVELSRELTLPSNFLITRNLFSSSFSSSLSPSSERKKEREWTSPPFLIRINLLPLQSVLPFLLFLSCLNFLCERKRERKRKSGNKDEEKERKSHESQIKGCVLSRSLNFFKFLLLEEEKRKTPSEMGEREDEERKKEKKEKEEKRFSLSTRDCNNNKNLRGAWKSVFIWMNCSFLNSTWLEMLEKWERKKEGRKK